MTFIGTSVCFRQTRNGKWRVIGNIRTSVEFDKGMRILRKTGTLQNSF